MMIRPFEFKDYHDVVMMYKDLIATIYPNRQLGDDINFFRMVDFWTREKRQIFVTEENDVLTGFAVGYVDFNYGLTEPIYFGDMAYVKPEYRKGKSAYLLYKKIVEMADYLGMKLYSQAFIGGNDKVDKIQQKFGGVPMFIGMERPIRGGV